MGRKRKPPLKTFVYNEIKENIVTCVYAPGQIMTEDELSSIHNASRTPIRDALARLEQDGLVEILPKKGVRISKLDIDDINNIYEARWLLESYCLEKYGPSINKSFFEDIYKELKNDGPFDLNAFYKQDSMIHGQIIAASNNRFFENLYHKLSLQTQRLFSILGHISPERLEKIREEHKDLMRACLLDEWTLAVELLAAHLHNGKMAATSVVLEQI